MNDVVLLLHGAFHGPWCFESVRDLLAERGVKTIAPELSLISRDTDVAIVIEVLDGLSGPVTLVGHSYGGNVATIVGHHRTVRSLVYLSSLPPDVAQGGVPIDASSAFVSALRFAEDRTVSIDPDRAVELFYGRSPRATAERWATHLRPGLPRGANVPTGDPAWTAKPTDYVVCTDDAVFAPDAQRAAAELMGAALHQIEGDHSPSLGRPERLAAVLVDIVDRRREPSS